MIGIFLFISFGYSVNSNEKPFHVAAAYVAIVSIVSLVLGGASIGPLLISAALLFIYSSFAYFILDRFGDGIFMNFVILLSGGLGLFFLPLLLI